jgi:hypothetical protein
MSAREMLLADHTADMSSDILYDECLPRRIHSYSVSIACCEGYMMYCILTTLQFRQLFRECYGGQQAYKFRSLGYRWPGRLRPA